MLGAYMFIIVIFLDLSIDHYVVLSFVSFHSLCFKVCFIWYEYCYSCFLLVSICMEYLSPITDLPLLMIKFNSVQLLSHGPLFGTPWIAARQASLSITNSWSSLKHTSIESVMPSRHLILCRPLFFLPPIPPNIRVSSNESTLRMRWPKYWSFSFSIIPSKEIPGLISFQMGWLDLPAVQGTLKSLLQHHSSKHQFFGAQLSSQSKSHIHTWLLEKP